MSRIIGVGIILFAVYTLLRIVVLYIFVALVIGLLQLAAYILLFVGFAAIAIAAIIGLLRLAGVAVAKTPWHKLAAWRSKEWAIAGSLAVVVVLLFTTLLGERRPPPAPPVATKYLVLKNDTLIGWSKLQWDWTWRGQTISAEHGAYFLRVGSRRFKATNDKWIEQ
jgi:hypothetical protein